jgi:cohesin domain-containing protein
MARPLHCAAEILAVALLFSVTGLSQGRANQPEPARTSGAAPSKETRIALASNSGPPGSSLVIPIYFTPAPGIAVGRLQVVVSFVSVNLKFESAERGVSAKLPNLDFSSAVAVGKNDKGVETSTVTVVASFPASAKSARGIPGGILGYLKLQINAKANAALIALRTKAEGALLGSDAALANLTTVDGQVEIAWVDAPPSVSCFFFTH